MTIQWVGHTWLHRNIKAFCLATEWKLVWARFTQMNGPGFMRGTNQLEGRAVSVFVLVHVPQRGQFSIYKYPGKSVFEFQE